VVAQVNKVVVEGMNDAEVIERLAKIGVEPSTNTPERFADYIRVEHERWGKVVREADIKME
jgi:tripartite-type tricarboxylate transporter receptor subunit TctC